MAVSPLADLIIEAQDAFKRRNRGVELTQADIVRRADGLLSTTEVSNFLTKVPKQMPKIAAKVGALAQAIERTEGEVLDAYLKTVGYVTLEMERHGIPRWKPGRPQNVEPIGRRHVKVSDLDPTVPLAAREGRRHEEDPQGGAQ